MGHLAEVQGLGVKGAFTAQADEPAGIAVEFDDIAAAPFLVQIIHVLGDNSLEPAHFFQGGQGQVGRIGAGSGDGIFQFQEQFPDLGRVREKGLYVGILHGIVAGPEAVRAPKAGDAAFHGYAGPGEGYGGSWLV